jgi:2-furoyl-CoA dehydrogenase FAD binding subunit
MKPASFDYACPTSKREVLALLAEHGQDARIIAGGQSLMAILNMRMTQPKLLIDINRVEELSYIKSNKSHLAVGACVRQAELLAWRGLGEAVPLLAQAIPWIGHFQTRNRGTVCGSLAHADPSSELPLCLIALGGELVLESAKGRRVVAADNFFQGILTTARRVDELVTEARFPLGQANTSYRFNEIAMRHGDFAIVSLAAVVGANEARLGVGGVADRPVVRNFAVGSELPAALNEMAWSLEAQDDAQASASYRRQLVRELGLRLIKEGY